MDHAAAFLGQEIDQRESLSERTAATRMSPTVMVERSITTLDAAVQTALIQTVTSIAGAHYSQAITLLSPSENAVKDLTVEQILEPFSDQGGNVIEKAKSYLGIEDFEGAKLMDYGTEAAEKQARTRVRSSIDTSKQGVPVNLAVGKVITVTLQKGNRDIEIPVTITPMPRVMNSDQMLDILSSFGRDNSIMGRYNQWTTGQIKSTLDYAFALDLARTDRKLLLNDSDGLYKEYRNKQAGASVTAFITKRKPMNIASNIFIVSKAFSLSMESAMRSRLSKARDRKKFFKNTGGSMLIVVDPIKEVATFYHRGIEASGKYSFDEMMSNTSSPNGIDLNSVMKAYQMGQGH